VIRVPTPCRLRGNVTTVRLRALVPVGITLVLAGCTSSAAPRRIATQSPVDTTLSWFGAVNRHDRSLIDSKFAPGQRREVANVLDWNLYYFLDVRCHASSESRLSATVRCVFKMRNPAPPEMLNVSFWDFDLQRSPSGPWLITGYGQG
jgi:hypothetical protein